MSTYDSYETVDRRHKSHRHRDRDRDRDEPQYMETRETYVRGPVAPDAPPYVSSRTDLIRRPGREDSDLSIEEVRRDFPPPGAGGAYLSTRAMDRYSGGGSLQRSRSADRGDQYGSYADDRSERRRSRRIVKEETVEPRRRSLSRNQKILAGVAGAALAVGGKELWDRRQNHGHAPEKRNLLASAAVGAAGAFAAYETAEFAAKKFGKEERREKTYTAIEDRNGRVAEYYSSGEDSDKPKKSRRKSFVEGALGLAGLGAAAKAVSDKDDRRGSESSRRDRSRGPGGGGEGVAKFQQAAKAALLAGAAEAFRVRNEPGSWGGAKGKRILTAAIGAGGIDAAADRDPEKKSKRHILEAVVGGLAGSHLINGPRSNLEKDEDGRSRSRSRAPSSSGGVSSGAGLAALATAGLGALAGKKLLDRSRSRDRDDDDRRRRSYSSDDDDRGDRHRKRSKSVTDYARKGLAALGIGEAADAGRDDRRRDIDDDNRSHRSRRRRDSSADDYDRPRGGGYDDRRRRDGQRNRKIAEGKKSASSDSDLGSSSEDEKKVKKMRGKQILTAGLATVATIHAAHNVYQSYEKRRARKRAVEEGEMTEEQARKLKSKAKLQDVASIGIAALGIKGAYSEWKEMKEVREEALHFREEKEERHKKRMERQKRGRDIHGHQGQDRNQLAITDGDRDGLRRDPRHASAPDLTYGGRYNNGPRYIDDNPYSAAPGTPTYYGSRR